MKIQSILYTKNHLKQLTAWWWYFVWFYFL